MLILNLTSQAQYLRLQCSKKDVDREADARADVTDRVSDSEASFLHAFSQCSQNPRQDSLLKIWWGM